MTDNQLAHAPYLFCCGIARSGAYNRTLTPFGFQNEFRTLWEATSNYVEMSPFMSANKIQKPILLIHEEYDDKFGLVPMRMASEILSQTLLTVSACIEPCKDDVSKGATDSGNETVGASGEGSPQLTEFAMLVCCKLKLKLVTYLRAGNSGKSILLK
ncbi:hypothetical protein WN943_017266 [Citrus x changshan-huyou]